MVEVRGQISLFRALFGAVPVLFEAGERIKVVVLVCTTIQILNTYTNHIVTLALPR